MVTKGMIRSVVVSPFQVNCWVLACPKTGLAAVIDPGDDVSDILRELEEMALALNRPGQGKFLLHTHAHLDHFGATRALYESLTSETSGPKTPASPGLKTPEIALHADDERLWGELLSQGRMFGLDFEPPIPVTRHIKDGEELELGELRLLALHTPGHSPGGMCFYLRPNPELKIKETVFSGDTLFQGSIGRTDLWGGNLETLLQSIRQKLWKLPDVTRVCSGHGPDTQIGAEKLGNPFVPKT